MNADSRINSAETFIYAAEFGKNCKNAGPNTGNERNWYSGDGLRVKARS